MLTVGEILKKTRIKKGLTLEEIEKNLRIRKKFLLALEENNWEKLPSLPYIKGFLKNYSRFLNLQPEEMLAIFRRQFKEKEKKELLPQGMVNSFDKKIFRLSPQSTLFLFFLFSLFLFFGYLFFQYYSLKGLPNLSVIKPQEGEIFSSSLVVVEGKTDPDAVLSINQQKIVVSPDGQFTTILTLPPGQNSVVIIATSKYGKKKIVVRNIQVRP